MNIHIKSLTKATVAVIALAFAGGVSAQTRAPQPETSIQPPVPQSSTSVQTQATHSDKEFFKKAAEQGQTDMDLAKLGEAKATDPALKRLATEIANDHMKANSELMALAKSKGVAIAPEPEAAHQKILKAFSEKSGAAFDTALREHLVKDHEKAIRMLQNAERESKDPQIRAFAAKQLPTMEQHLAAAQGLAGVRTTERTTRPGEATTAPGKETTTTPSSRVRTE